MSFLRTSGKLFEIFIFRRQISRLACYRRGFFLPIASETCFRGEQLSPKVAKYSTNVALSFQPGEDSEKDPVISYSVDDALSELDRDAKRMGRVFKRRVGGVFRMIQDINKVSSIQILYLIRCCGSLLRDAMPRERTELAHKIWAYAKSAGVPLDASHYNSLLKVYLENGEDFSPVEFLSNMEKEGVKPNRVTFQRLIEKFCENGDMAGATTVLEHMKEQKVAVGEPVFNSLLKCHGKQGDFEGAKSILKVMSDAQLTPTLETYIILACCYAEKGEIQQLRATLEEAKLKDHYVSDKSYLDIIYRLAVSGHEKHAEDLLNEVKDFAQCRQHCANIILDLVNAGKFETALDIVLRVSENIDFSNGVSLFVKQLVIAGVPVDSVKEYCNVLQKYNEYVVFYATKSALENEKLTDIPGYFQMVINQGFPIRQHYFWPLLAAHRRHKNEAGIWDTLRMMHDMAVPADGDTYTEYVFPSVSNVDSDSLLDNVKRSGQSESLAVEPLYYFYCKTGNFKNALNLGKKYQITLKSNPIVSLLITSYKPGEQDDDLLQILHAVYGNSRFGINEGICDYGKVFLRLQAEGKLSLDLLKKAHKSGITLSRSSCDTLCKQIGRNDPDHLQVVRSMQFDSGAAIGFEDSSTSTIHPRDMNLQELEKRLLEVRQAGGSTRAILSSLLTLYCKKRDLQKVIETKNELDSQGFIFTPGSYAIMISTCVSCGNYEEASKLKERLSNEYPDFKLDAVKTIDYINLLLQYGKTNEAADMLEKECSELEYPGRKERMFDSVRRLLGTAASTGEVDLTKRIYDTFMSKLNITSPLLEFVDSLVNVYLARNDIDGAIAEYKQFAVSHNLFPCRSKLFKKFIVENNHEKLQMLIDLSTMHGARYSILPDLALCFIETGHFQQACKTLQSVSGRMEKSQIEVLCRRLFRQNRVAELEQFIAASKSLTSMDRDQLYFYLLQLYSQANDYGKALEVWNSMQEENIQPSVKSLCLIADLLKRNGQPVPFAIPELSLHSADEDREREGFDVDNVDSDVFSRLQQNLGSGDSDAVIKALSEMKKGHVRSLSTMDMTKIIELLATTNNLRSIISNVQVMSYLIEKARQIVKPLLERYSESGDVELVRSFVDFLPDFTLKNINFSYHYFKAYNVSGKQESLLSELEQNIKKNVKMFSFAGFLELLETAPHLEDRASKLVDMYSKEANFDAPRRVLWLHNFVHRKFDKADEIFKQFPGVFGNIDSLATSVLKSVRNNQDVVVGQKYLAFIKDQPVRQIIRDRAYSCVLDVLVQKSDFREAQKLVEAVQKQQIPLNIFSETTLMLLKKQLEEHGEPVTFKLPMMQVEESSDSSDSDEVVKGKENRP